MFIAAVHELLRHVEHSFFYLGPAICEGPKPRTFQNPNTLNSNSRQANYERKQRTLECLKEACGGFCFKLLG